MGSVIAASSPGLAILWLIYLVVIVFEIAAFWQLFAKAGEAGWQAIIPVWSTIVLIKIAGRPLWWVILYFIPFVNIVIHFIVSIEVARAFGKGTGYGVLLALFPYVVVPMLGFGSAQYVGSRPGGFAPAY